VGISAEKTRGLSEKIAIGSRKAESDLVLTYYGPLLSWLRGKLPELATAEDICQECFIVAIRALRRNAVRDPAKVGSFLFGVAARQIATNARTNRISLSLKDIDVDELEAQAHRPLEGLINETEASAVRKAICMLSSPRDRELLVRRYLLDQNGAQIQRDLRLTPVVFKKAISRARGRMQQILLREGVAQSLSEPWAKR
jgi:RNA polymerase sigma-70 factor (ECF subfamily)